jgi:hypothetical protein
VHGDECGGLCLTQAFILGQREIVVRGHNLRATETGVVELILPASNLLLHDSIEEHASVGSCQRQSSIIVYIELHL